ncbi:unnamed protein product [Ambrosiozyma monospora]|uniref:Unnamed protein product n=1 Tax=Ambrosiozyma monospora TaxID=43982 RepID=A0ACB5TA13_AMBMO|nr:unnamed protein product [Ambrosiozyma monospora]
MCAKGFYDEAKELIESGANVNDADYAGNTPLHEAALEGYLEIVELLLDNGAEIDKQSGVMDKDTALIDAASNLHYDVVRLLLERDANPTLVNAMGDTALDTLERDRDVSSLDKDELSSFKKLKKLLAQSTREFRKKFKSSTVNGNDTDSERDIDLSRRQTKNTFYDLISREGRSEIYGKVADNDVTFVLNYVSNLSGRKPPSDLLSLAAKHGHSDIASLLLAFHANVNHADKNGLTPLMYAVGKEHIAMVKLLLENKANPVLKDKSGRSALDILLESDFPDEEEVKLIKTASENFKGSTGSSSRSNSTRGTPRKSKKRTKKRKRAIETSDEEDNDDVDAGNHNQSDMDVDAVSLDESDEKEKPKPKRKKFTIQTEERKKLPTSLTASPVSASASEKKSHMKKKKSMENIVSLNQKSSFGMSSKKDDLKDRLEKVRSRSHTPTSPPKLSPEEIEAKKKKEEEELLAS